MAHQVEECGSLRQTEPPPLQPTTCWIPHPGSFPHEASYSAVLHSFMLLDLAFFKEKCNKLSVFTFAVITSLIYTSAAKHKTQSNKVFTSETLILWSLQMWFSYLQTLQRQWVQDVNSFLNLTKTSGPWRTAHITSRQSWSMIPPGLISPLLLKLVFVWGGGHGWHPAWSCV